MGHLMLNTGHSAMCLSTAGIQYCREALLHCETDLRARVALSRALLASGDQEESEEECAAVLRADPNHRDGCMVCVWGGGGPKVVIQDS